MNEMQIKSFIEKNGFLVLTNKKIKGKNFVSGQCVSRGLFFSLLCVFPLKPIETNLMMGTVTDTVTVNLSFVKGKVTK